MRHSRIVVIAATLTLVVVATGVSAAAGGRPAKKLAATPVCRVGPSPLSFSNHVALTGGCKVNGKPVASNWTWQVIGETDASGAPLPAETTSGTGANVPIPIVGGYKLQITAKVSTAKTKAHQAGHTTGTPTAQLGGYTAIGTQMPSVRSFTGGGPFCTWSDVPFNVPDTSPTATLPSVATCGPDSTTGACPWQPTPPQPPTDLYPTEAGVITTTPLTVYGGRFACTQIGWWAIPSITVLFGYTDSKGDATTCRLAISGVTSFTLPPDWGGYVSFYVALLTFGPSGYFYADYTKQTPYMVRTSGTLNVCQAYNLPP